MISPPLPLYETERLASLYRLAVLDTPGEERFDRITRLASRALGVPIALVSLVDANRQWFKSCVGLEASETGRDISFCGHAILGQDTFVIPDTLLDPRFADNPLVTGEPHIRFYAGQPLADLDGLNFGTLCIIDQQPREFSESDRQTLRDLGTWAAQELNVVQINQAVQTVRESEARTQALLEELRDQKEFTSNLLQHSAVATVVINADHQVMLWNQAVEDLTGVKAQAVLGTNRHWSAFYPQPRLTLADIIVDQIYQELSGLYSNYYQLPRSDRNALHAEGWYCNLNGKDRYLVFDAQPVFDRESKLVAAVTTMQDYTDRKLAQEEIQNQRDFAQQVMNTMGQGLAVTNAAGAFEYVNPAFAHMLNYSAESLVGQSSYTLVAAEDAALARQASERRLSGETTLIEVRLRRSDDSLVDVLISGVPRGRAGKGAGTISVITDLTERKKVERLKTEFISTVSHELRTPLTSIRGSLGLVTGGLVGEIPAEARAMIEIAHKNSERLVRLINDILDIEKIASGKMEFQLRPLELLPLIETALAANRSYATQYGVTFELLETTRPDVQVQADPDRLTQVITNLLSNAAKFSFPGGTVRLTVEPQGEGVRVSVSDNGPGIAPEFQNQIFQRFAQADASSTRQQGGTGLGLSISKAIIESMNGTLGFQTVLGQGTTFYFDLPCLVFPPQVETIRSTAAEVPLLSRRVLVCEDDQDVALLLSMMLGAVGVESDLAYNAAQARQLLTDNPQRYAAMTLDLMLPDEDGLSLLRDLRERTGGLNLPVIVVSAKAQLGRREFKGASVGVLDWIDKPIDQERLVTALRQAFWPTRRDKPLILHIEDDPDNMQVVRGMLVNLVDLAEASSLREAKQRLQEQSFDLILLDQELLDGQGLDLLLYLSSGLDQWVPVVVFSAQEVDREISNLVAATLVKSRTSDQDLINTIRALVRSEPQLLD